MLGAAGTLAGEHCVRHGIFHLVLGLIMPDFLHLFQKNGLLSWVLLLRILSAAQNAHLYIQENYIKLAAVRIHMPTSS